MNQTKHTAAKDSGINEAATTKFPGSTVTVGSAASGAGDNREIPLDEGGDISKATGRYVCPHGSCYKDHVWGLRSFEVRMLT